MNRKRLASALPILFVLLPTYFSYAQAPLEETTALYYTIRERATLFFEPDSSLPFAHIDFREPVYVLQKSAPWWKVRTLSGVEGYVYQGTLSNLWLKISKAKRMLYVYQGVELIKKMPIDLGVNFKEDKIRRAALDEKEHWRTPEGFFFVCARNPHSQYYKALVLNYPTAEDAERGLREGLISLQEYRAIIAAERNFRPPPMHTALGGLIEIHGRGTGGRANWTRGCIAVRDVHMDQLWEWVPIGTPVLIE